MIPVCTSCQSALWDLVSVSEKFTHRMTHLCSPSWWQILTASEDSSEKCLECMAGHFLLELAFAVKSGMNYPSLHAVIKLACCPTLIITTVAGSDLSWV